MKEVRFFYVERATATDCLPDEETNHALKVLRLKAGDKVFLMDGEGSFHRAEIVDAKSKRCQYRIVESLPQQKTWTNKLHLAIAPTKMMERMEWLAEKATEVGFDELSFLRCTFSERKVIRKDRIDKIVVSAMKQSRKPWRPVVNEIVSFKKFLAEDFSGKRYIAHCYDEIERKNFFDILSTEKFDKDEEITVLIGPEGDFSIDEVKQAVSNGYVSVSLGESRLRTETAGLAAVMMMQLKFGKR